MGVLKFFKNLFSSNTQVEENKEETQRAVYLEKEDLSVNREWGREKSVDEKIKILKRLKYTQSAMDLDNNLEKEILNYLISRESSNFNVYWNLYIPYGRDKYMQIDLMVITGEIIYVIECKEYKTCTSIEKQGEQWLCYYNSGHVYKNPNGIAQNDKHIDVLKKYLSDFSFNYESVVPIIVADDFNSEISDNDVIIVRRSEFAVLFKILDRRIESEKCLECIDENFVNVNKSVYKCMNATEEIIQGHKENIKIKYGE